MNHGPPSPPRRLKHKDPRDTMPAVVAIGQSLAPHEDFYHWVLTRSWPAFFGWVTLAYLVTNLVFGTAYWLVPQSVTSAEDFVDCLFFSVETFATIGYGEMTPHGRLSHAIVMVEALAGILATATITGVTFARFARPTARILFSENAVIGPRNGVPTLMFRMANWRRNQIAEAQLAVMVLLTETTREGETMRRPMVIKLERERNPMFLLTWTAMHVIEEGSPFYGPDAMERLREKNAEIFLSLTGLDETIGQTINTRYRYQLDEIVVNARFVDVLMMKEGVRVIDYDRFHEIERLDS